MNLKHYSIIFSVTGILFLYILTFFCKPYYIDLSQISNYENKKVITNGKVIEITETKYKNQILKIQNNNSTAKIFSEEKTNVEYGDIIQAEGMVQKYEDYFEIIVKNKENIRVIEKWSNITLPLSQVSIHPNQYVGVNVKIKGYIEDIYNSFFNLKDFETDHMILVSYSSKNSFYLQSGKEVIVKGLFTYEEKNLRYIIKIYDDQHGISLRDDFA